VCGIYGIINLDGTPADPAVLSAMGRVTIHRGPDDEGTHADGPCALGMRRLSIIDLAGGHQPLSNGDGTLWLVANGEVYNFRELRRELEAKGHRFKTGSDCESIIHAYAEYGDDFVARLNGMYAFALWDARRRRLLIGRDRLGIKPLYYFNDGRRLAFASEAKALLELPGVKPEVDPVALRAYLELGYVPAPLSMFRKIAKLPIGSILSVTRDRPTIRSYWRPNGEVDPTLSPEDWSRLVRTRMEEAVRMQMVSDVPIGAFLSGGIDSSAVLAFMAKHSDTPVRTYSIGFSGGPADSYYNELPYARQVAELFGSSHHEILVRPDVVSLLPKLLWHMDEPIADSAFVTTYLVAEFARREVTVILSGVGGDELFGGYRRYLGEHYMRYLAGVPRPLKRAAAALADRLPSDRHSALLNLSRYAKSFLSTADLSFEERYRAYVGVFAPGEAHEYLAVVPPDRFDAIGTAFATVTGADPLNRMFGVDALTQLPDDLLLLTDKMTMATSLECRVPLLDHDLVELASRIPTRVKVAGGELKHLMKKSLEGVLPKEILHRSKRGFGAPMGAWLKGELFPLITSVLSRESIEARGYLRYEPIRRLIDGHRANRVDGTDRLLSLLNFELWCRIFLDRAAPEDVADQLRETAA
jgi:asparagine synthase (glutamine-hydrolysing)